MKRHRRPPSQSWRTFLSNHAEVIVAIDFFTVPTATFRILYAFIVIEHKCRRIVHFNVTSHPTAQQIVDAFSFDTTSRYLLSDNDGVYGAVFQRRLVKEYLGYYHHSRNHLSLNKDSPMPRPIQSRMDGIIVAFPVLGGLHHRYVRTAA